jgi:hypothetical protein
MPRRAKVIREPIELAEAGAVVAAGTVPGRAVPYPPWGGDEMFRDIPGFPGYRVGDGGSVWSCKRRGPSGKIAPGMWRRLHPKVDKKRRRSVILRDESGLRRDMVVARCVLLAFVGPCPDGMEACHFPDRDPGNNALVNLRWDTRKNNFVDRDIHGTTARGERVGRSKMTADGVRLMRKMRDRGVSYDQLVQAFGVKKTQVSRIVRRQSWAHI